MCPHGVRWCSRYPAFGAKLEGGDGLYRHSLADRIQILHWNTQRLRQPTLGHLLQTSGLPALDFAYTLKMNPCPFCEFLLAQPQADSYSPDVICQGFFRIWSQFLL